MRGGLTSSAAGTSGTGRGCGMTAASNSVSAESKGSESRSSPATLASVRKSAGKGNGLRRWGSGGIVGSGREGKGRDANAMARSEEAAADGDGAK